ncbi:hypothetical protein N7470_005614 [Penicillium chermesinum]|nr:hypothetical protein N7470_005614 [Penicillium chermesinum]
MASSTSSEAFIGCFSPERPTSPVDPRYTQLGALKLGSLRVVNGCASPCPSDRVPLESRSVEVVPQPSLEIPSVIDIKKSEDLPGSPFSFEKSPIITPNLCFLREMEDEGIAMYTDIQLDKDTMDVSSDRSTSRSLGKTDSGYSSANSFHSIQRSQTRLSLDSQASGSGSMLGPDDRTQHYASLHGEKSENFSWPRLASTRWDDSSSATPQPGSRNRRSTLCAPLYTEYSESDGSVPPRLSFQGDRIVSETSRLSTSTDILPIYEQVNALHRSTSGSSETGICRSRSRSRSRSRAGSRVWCQRPGIDVPPLPTILFT